MYLVFYLSMRIVLPCKKKHFSSSQIPFSRPRPRCRRRLPTSRPTPPHTPPPRTEEATPRPPQSDPHLRGRLLPRSTGSSPARPRTTAAAQVNRVAPPLLPSSPLSWPTSVAPPHAASVLTGCPPIRRPARQGLHRCPQALGLRGGGSLLRGLQDHNLQPRRHSRHGVSIL